MYKKIWVVEGSLPVWRQIVRLARLKLPIKQKYGFANLAMHFVIFGNLAVSPVVHKWISSIWIIGCYGLRLILGDMPD